MQKVSFLCQRAQLLTLRIQGCIRAHRRIHGCLANLGSAFLWGPRSMLVCRIFRRSHQQTSPDSGSPHRLSVPRSSAGDDPMAHVPRLRRPGDLGRNPPGGGRHAAQEGPAACLWRVLFEGWSGCFRVLRFLLVGVLIIRALLFTIWGLY